MAMGWELVLRRVGDRRDGVIVFGWGLGGKVFGGRLGGCLIGCCLGFRWGLDQEGKRESALGDGV